MTIQFAVKVIIHENLQALQGRKTQPTGLMLLPVLLIDEEYGDGARLGMCVEFPTHREVAK